MWRPRASGGTITAGRSNMGPRVRGDDRRQRAKPISRIRSDVGAHARRRYENERTQFVQAKATLSRVRAPNRSEERATALPPSAR